MAGASAISAGLVRPGGAFADLVRLAAAQVEVALCEPIVWPSEHGLLARELVAANDFSRGPGGVAYEGGGHVCEGGGGFGGAVPGPTLRLYPGDRLKLKLINRLSGTLINDSTNIHVHGLHVSPRGSGDNVFITVEPDGEFQYEFQIPDKHPTGLFWYHPHFHGQARDQVNAGLAGAIIITERPGESPNARAALVATGARYPGPEARERLLVLQRLNPPPPTAPTGLLVNGQNIPTITIRRGEEQRWQILNASADNFFNIRVVDHELRRIAVDGNWIPNYGALPPLKVLPLGPAERAEVLITGLTEGERPFYEVRTLKKKINGQVQPPQTPVFDQDLEGIADDDMVIVADYDLLAKVVIEEGAAGTPTVPPQTASPLRRAPRKETPDREITFSPDPIFSIDNQYFSHGRVDQTVVLGATEMWRIFNEHEAFAGWHPFHLHVNDFDVLHTSVSPGELQPAFYQDTVPLPPLNDEGPGRVDISSTFADFTGRFVYHCHFLFHEDHGMMAVVEVVQPVEITGFAFAPQTVTIHAGPTVCGEVNSGTTVVWTNLDEDVHTVTADEVDGLTGRPLFDSGDLATCRSFAHTFDAPGMVTYHCAKHPDEKGEIVVTAEQTIEIIDSAFAPDSVEVARGTTVTWTNRDAASHAVTADDVNSSTGEPVFGSAPLDREKSFRHTFDTFGLFAYRCALHPEMTGALRVTEVTRRSVSIGISDEGLDQTEITMPPRSTVTWANRSSHPYSIQPTALFESGTLEPERVFEPGKPINPGMRFSHLFAGSDMTQTTVEYTVQPAGPEGTARTGKIHVVGSVTIVGSGFVPETVTIPAGAAVTWTNQDVAEHTATATNVDPATGEPFFDTGPLGQGECRSHTFETAGTFVYHCTAHPETEGTVVVT
jgi:FtsP/CotA-like multicopper oxidase with cupredoxin domain/plastocyanin